MFIQAINDTGIGEQRIFVNINHIVSLGALKDGRFFIDVKYATDDIRYFVSKNTFEMLVNV